MNLSGDNKASGSPHRSRLDENAAVDADANDLGNIGLVIDLLRRDEPENLTLDSDNGKNPLRLKNGDFIPLQCLNEKTLDFVNEPNGDGRLLQKLPLLYLHGDAVTASVTILSDARLRSNPNEYDRFNKKSRPLNLSSELKLSLLIATATSSTHGVISEPFVEAAVVVVGI